MSQYRIDQITNQAGTAGPQVAGIATFSSSSGLVMPSGDTRYRYSGTDGNIVTDGLVLYLDAGRKESFGGDGTTWRDLSGKGNNGTLVNGVGYDYEQGGSLVFDGVNDYAYSSLSSVVPITNPYTFELWAYWPTGGSWQTGIGFGNELLTIGANFGSNPGSGLFYGLGQWNNGSDTISLFNPSDNFFTPYVLPSRDTWYHIVGISETGTNQSKLYVNGELKNTGTLTATGTTTYTGIAIGGGYYGVSDKRISNVRLYTKVLTATEVLQNYNALKGRYGL